MSDIKDFNAMRSSQMTETNVKTSVELLKMQRNFEEMFSKALVCLNALEHAVFLNQESIEKSIPAAAEKLSKCAIESIKAQVTGELTIEMDRLQSNIAGYREALQGLQHDAHYARSMSRKHMALICLSAILGSGATAAAIVIWSGFTLSDNTMTYQKVGSYVHNIIIKQPAEIQQSFWNGLAKLNHKE